MANEDERVSQFCELTGANASRASEYLTQTNYDMEMAVAAFYADAEEGDDAGAPAASSSAAAAPEPEYTGPRTLDGRPAPQSAFASASSASKKAPKRRGIATLGSLGGGHDHDDDDDDDEDDEDEEGKPRDLFAGGEKSGLAVQDPDNKPKAPAHAKKVISDILAQAKANSKRPNPDSDVAAAGSSQPSRFRGSGQTVGGDGVDSRTIPDPRGQPIPRVPTEPTGPVQERILHLWSDGFSIDDGPLRRFDEPENAADLQMIRSGRAPLHLMNVDNDQPVDVKLQQHDENWRQIPHIYRPFGGQGRRLGSPVPGDGNVAITTAAAPAPAPAATSSSSSSQGPSTNVDSSQPSITLRVTMPDGSRLPARFNLTNTIGDLYSFVRGASAETRGRPFLVQSTFPSKDYTDHDQQLKDIDAFKKGGIAVIKWA